MYEIKYDGQLLAATASTDRPLAAGSIAEDVYGLGGGSIVIYRSPAEAPLLPLQGRIEIFEDDNPAPRWVLCCTRVQQELDGKATLSVQSELAYLKLTLHEPWGYHGTAADFLGKLIMDYNRQLDVATASSRHLRPGTVSLTGDTAYACTYDGRATHYDMLMDAIDALGGHLLLHQTAGSDNSGHETVIDWTDAWTPSPERAEVGKNLLRYEAQQDSRDIATCLYAGGAEELAVKIEHPQLVRRYGKIYAEHKWPEISSAEELRRTGMAWLTQRAEAASSIEAVTADLSLIDDTAQRVNVGDMIQIFVPDRGIDIWAPVTGKKTDLADPGRTKITCGRPAPRVSAQLERLEAIDLRGVQRKQQEDAAQIRKNTSAAANASSAAVNASNTAAGASQVANTASQKADAASQTATQTKNGLTTALSGKRVLSGTATISFGASSQTVTVNFSSAFSAKPAVVVQQVFDKQCIVVKTSDITTSRFTARLAGGFGSSGSRQFCWIAIG